MHDIMLNGTYTDQNGEAEWTVMRQCSIVYLPTIATLSPRVAFEPKQSYIKTWW